MGRWSENEPSAPEGMQRIAYDSDTNRYTFRDADGSVYEGGEYGGNLRLVSRPSRAKDNEPIRLFPVSPTSRTGPGVPSPTSPTSFNEMLPAHMITTATPIAPSKSPSTAKAPKLPAGQTSTDSGGRRSLWGVVRRATAPTKMRNVVDAVARRPSALRKEVEPVGRYARLSSSGDHQRPYDGGSLASDVSAGLSLRKSGKSGHPKQRTV